MYVQHVFICYSDNIKVNALITPFQTVFCACVVRAFFCVLSWLHYIVVLALFLSLMCCIFLRLVNTYVLRMQWMLWILRKHFNVLFSFTILFVVRSKNITSFWQHTQLKHAPHTHTHAHIHTHLNTYTPNVLYIFQQNLKKAHDLFDEILICRRRQWQRQQWQL